MSEPADPVVIACGADDRYAMPLAVTLHSALSRMGGGQGGAQVFVIDGGLGQASRARLVQVVEAAAPDVRVQVVAPDLSPLDGLKTAGYFAASIYLRLLIPDVVPPQARRVIYLDSDLLVRGDLRGLWQADFAGKALLAGLDFGTSTLGRTLPNWQALGVDPEAPYVNSGVLVIDLRRWRAEGIAGRIIRYVRDHRDLLNYPDQDAINAVLADDLGLLDPRWNVPVYLGSDLVFDSLAESPVKAELRGSRWRLLNEAHIYHFLGPRKPWQFGSGVYGQREWLAALDRSGWHGPGQVGRRLTTWALRADWLARTALRRARGAGHRAGPSLESR